MAKWSDEELRASVKAYLKMQAMQRSSQPYVKKEIYRDLAAQFGRKPGAFERRMMNISAVLEFNDLEWLVGLAPNRNVGSAVGPRIAGILSEQGVPARYETTNPAVQWPFFIDGDFEEDEEEPAVGGQEQPQPTAPPPGVLQPIPVTISVKVYPRDEAVRAYAIKRAAGKCECCRFEAPFVDKGGLPFLEVHHLRQLAAAGSDRTSNAVAVCPNCHRRLHFGMDSEALLTRIYEWIPELRPE